MQVQGQLSPNHGRPQSISKCNLPRFPFGSRKFQTFYKEHLPVKCQSLNTEDKNLGKTQEDTRISKPLLAGGAVGLGAAAFVAIRLLSGAPSFENLERASTPLDTALQNGKPTVIEFYASWCNICRELLPDTLEVQRQYSRDVNFVALNIENSRWAPEVSEYRVRGVPYYAFLDGSGHQQAAAVGRLPREVLEGDTKALAQGTQLPFARVQKAASAAQLTADRARALPRDHS